MCQSCLRRADRLRELAARFEGLATADPGPLSAARLILTASELTMFADQLALSCGLDDIGWAEDDDPDAPDLFAAAEA